MFVTPIPISGHVHGTDRGGERNRRQDDRENHFNDQCDHPDDDEASRKAAEGTKHDMPPAIDRGTNRGIDRDMTRGIDPGPVGLGGLAPGIPLNIALVDQASVDQAPEATPDDTSARLPDITHIANLIHVMAGHAPLHDSHHEIDDEA